MDLKLKKKTLLQLIQTLATLRIDANLSDTGFSEILDDTISLDNLYTNTAETRSATSTGMLDTINNNSAGGLQSSSFLSLCRSGANKEHILDVASEYDVNCYHFNMHLL